jgi:hypothetical protein
MRMLYQSNLPKGFIDLYESQDRLFFSSAFTRRVNGVCLEIPLPEARDLTEALLRTFDERVRDSIIRSVTNATRVSNSKDG